MVATSLFGVLWPRDLWYLLVILDYHYRMLVILVSTELESTKAEIPTTAAYKRLMKRTP
jgi:hypothetical protein